MQEQADRDQPRAGIELQRVESWRLGIFEDQRPCFGMAPGGLDCDRRAQPGPIENDRGRGKMTCAGEVIPGGVSILVGAGLRWMYVYTLPKAAIIEGKNIH